MITRKKGFDWNKRTEIEKCLRIAWNEVEKSVSLNERLRCCNNLRPKYPSGAKSGLVAESGPELVYVNGELKPASLPIGSMVFSAEETAKILESKTFRFKHEDKVYDHTVIHGGFCFRKKPL